MSQTESRHTSEFQLTFGDLRRLRKLRLWHWREVMSARLSEATNRDRSHDKAYEASWPMFCACEQVDYLRGNMHLKVVTDLNLFFPGVGDMAEADEALARKIADDNQRT